MVPYQNQIVLSSCITNRSPNQIKPKLHGLLSVARISGSLMAEELSRSYI